MQRAVILNSRQPLRPCGADAWVRATNEALAWIGRQGLLLNCSVGQPSWELTLALASAQRRPVRVFVPVAHGEDEVQEVARVTKEFDLSYEEAELVVVGKDASLSKAEAMRARDLAVVRQSDILIPVSVRRGGFMNRAVTSPEGKYVVTSFGVPHQTRRVGLAYEVESSDLTAEAARFDEPFVIHWTRTATGPWPGETRLEYYQSIAASDEYPRVGFHTLRHILDTRRLVASDWRMPDCEPCVCFSTLTPIEAVSLMRWRSRYRRMSFEPYGIGFSRPAAEKLPILPVLYYDADTEKPPSDDERWRWQAVGDKTDWRRECEFRHCGDIDFGSVADKDIAIFCRFDDEAERLRREFGLRVIPFCER